MEIVVWGLPRIGAMGGGFGGMEAGARAVGWTGNRFRFRRH